MTLLIKESKHKIRKAFLNKRLLLNKSEVDKKSKDVAKNLFLTKSFKRHKNILVYIPINKEVETKGIIDKLLKENKKIIIPAYSKRKYILSEFNKWNDLEEGPFGILQPVNLKKVDSSEVDVALLPAIAFSKKGVRLGYGKGVFDRLLKNKDMIKIGLAFEFQLIATIPQDKHDLIMDYVITEKKVVDTSTY